MIISAISWIMFFQESTLRPIVLNGPIVSKIISWYVWPSNDIINNNRER